MLTAERARELLDYDRDTGIFTWRKARPGVSLGSEAGGVNQRGYIRIGLDGRLYRAHRIAFLIIDGEWPQNCVDHKDRNPANNRWDNLRKCTQAQNVLNSAPSRSSASGFKGVEKHRDGWQCRVSIDGERVQVGNFKSAFLAARAYDAAAREAYGEFACTNF